LVLDSKWEDFSGAEAPLFRRGFFSSLKAAEKASLGFDLY
jgi:hypothetical protein